MGPQNPVASLASGHSQMEDASIQGGGGFVSTLCWERVCAHRGVWVLCESVTKAVSLLGNLCQGLCQQVSK